ncbi:MAG: GMP synthase [Zetaproteobacteria bacterium CG12_big_fil_rev_8_21_14_0_65_55_1124]|nr:MAG: GMP synthase [Zetaproteobacteria bacterium CG1_02_55_237]PIS19731.1 MAG: GMP synthase [Zetaproteobacteria bacterium CG08_land_8_20_14_0_20_55_17]PIW43497.1 MAG: GMP synthase [Zetaproteobacteria bacterium CG12_big_fil_rev_8_21_14_0_65_55_1124]PIY54150.1 MAG: GMP synthase [Zetaproteobacteria bacterium CG_4_10_14_0_8_um_filter_55_43]PIZ39122.1 MAG: GMP synthase [Zetaproteobacteria bacterium CG_4_10_14_0_2_um_filter_55_20]PJB81535.1 MAG: GMP synthase [Zetaproteobacteria bacterium CG_4_9_14
MRFLIIQHLDIEPPALIADVLRNARHELSYVHLSKGETLPQNTHDIAGVIIMGGPQSANDSHLPYIQAELKWLEQGIREGLPMLGICLGAQLMAKAAGAAITASPSRELGWYPVFPTSNAANDPLFSFLPENGLPVFQWHGETFSIPDSASPIATHPEVPAQAFRLGKAQYGMQFHFEVDAPLIAQWIDAGESERSHLGPQGISELNTQTTLYLDATRGYGRQIVLNWLSLLD